MASDMTTEEMVAQIRKYHANTEAVGPHEYDAQMLAIAARLEALDKVARAAKEVTTHAYEGSNGASAIDNARLRALDNALADMEAGYGE